MVGTSVEFGAALDLCRAERRRIVLATLAGRAQQVSLADLAATVVEHERHARPTAAADEALTRVESSLHHVHLPKLAAAGVVDYDADRRLVEPTAQFERGEPHLSAILDADPTLAAPLEA